MAADDKRRSTRASSRSWNVSERSTAGRSASSAGTARRPTTVVSVELNAHSTYTVARLTLSRGASRWVKRSVVALLVWATTATAGSFMSTLVDLLR